jgi:FkbM family methyltransferase
MLSLHCNDSKMNFLRLNNLGRKLISALLHPLSRKALLRYRVLAATEHHYINQLEFATLIDVGANRGQFSLAFRRFHPSSKIVAFEPLAAAIVVLRQLFSGDKNFIAIAAAVGGTRTRAKINVSRSDDSSSLLPIGENQLAMAPKTGLSHTETIDVTRLNDAIVSLNLPLPILLKIDVQGYELEVLRGSIETLANISHIYCECSFITLYSGQALAHEIISFLMSEGFQLAGIHNIHYAPSGGAVQGDFLFRNTNEIPVADKRSAEIRMHCDDH